MHSQKKDERKEKERKKELFSLSQHITSKKTKKCNTHTHIPAHFPPSFSLPLSDSCNDHDKDEYDVQGKKNKKKAK